MPQRFVDMLGGRTRMETAVSRDRAARKQNPHFLTSTAEPFTERERERLRLRRQWRVVPSTQPRPTTPGWQSIELTCGYRLDHHPDTRIVHHADESCGFVLIGIAVDPGRPTEDPSEYLARIDLEHDDAAITRWLVRTGGVYALLRYTSRRIRVYSDPGNMLGMYWKNGIIASTPVLLPDVKRDPDVDRAYPLGGANEWYPGTLTPFRNVIAVPANHSFDVQTGAKERFWPTIEPIRGELDEGQTVRMLGDTLVGMMRGIVHRGPVIAGLSGGRDSRVVLSASRDMLSENPRAIEWFTLHGPGLKTDDLQLASELARTCDLDHRPVPVAPPADWLVEMFDEMTGRMVTGGARLVCDAARRLATTSAVHVNGALGELCMPYYWHNESPVEVRLDSLARKHGSRPPIIMDAVQQWLTSAEHLRPTTIYNLMHLEQLGGRWWSAVETAGRLFYDSFTPFSHRGFFEALCTLPPDVVASDTLRERLMRRLWPAVCEVPLTKRASTLGSALPRSTRERIKGLLSPRVRQANRAERPLGRRSA